MLLVRVLLFLTVKPIRGLKWVNSWKNEALNEFSVLLSNGFMCGQGLTSVEKFIFPGIIKLENDERLEIFDMSK